MRQGKETLELVAKPNVFSALVALIALTLFIGSQYMDRIDRRQEHSQTQVVLEKIVGRLEALERLGESRVTLEAHLRVLDRLGRLEQHHPDLKASSKKE